MVGWFSKQRSRYATLIRDREIFVRTDGDIKFLTISARLQHRVITGIALALGLWLIITIGMAGYQFATSGDRAEIASREAQIKAKEARVKAYQSRFANEAERLDERQTQLENLFKDHFGEDQTATDQAADAAISPENINAAPNKNSASISSTKSPNLTVIDARQRAFAKQLQGVVEARIARAEMALREVGLNPATIGQGGTAGQGGPFIPMARKARSMQDPALDGLSAALNRMEVFERALLALPLGNPAISMEMSSGYGYRHDPFSGAGAFHAGLDFKGPIGTPIYAASAGTVSFVGVQSGYGNVVEIDHGHGIITRYAHLSGFDVTLGTPVTAGVQIARMGNTGRSTGPHLHFEVRINGSAVDPRRFLEAKDNVLKIKDLAGQRVSSVSGGK
jgi:murein DD-endopeptidase MepM/ murein hydrolase activator NlpD